MCTLFFLPGSALPEEQWLEGFQFDKLVHAGLFAFLVLNFCTSFGLPRNKAWPIPLIAIGFGYLVEIIQRDWIPNRDYDLHDVLADGIGAMAGFLLYLLLYNLLQRKDWPE